VGSKYLLEEPLGRGATGTVWRARVREAADPAGGAASQPGELVAIKVLKEELAGDADVVMRFLRERSVLLRLTHPNIVRTRDLVVEGDLLALVMDLVDGPDLHRYLRENGPFSPMGAALLTAAVADALAASHRDGVVHRDLKPANVLLASGADGTEMHPMLTDFGIARLADSPGVTRTHEFVGTPAYVAPESAEGLPQTSAVDVYGAGILLYELVTGHPPFRGGTALEVLHQHLSDPPRRPSTVPDPLWTVIERCLRKDPGERPGAESLARALRVVGRGIGVHASPEAAEAALGVAALLVPDPEPARVPGTGAAASRRETAPTQVMPTGSRAADQSGPAGPGGPHTGQNVPYGRHDPDAATSVLPSAPDRTGGTDEPAAGGPAGGTRVMPPLPEGAPADGSGSHHPWESQLSAARRRNEQTEVQYLDPDQDPLRHRPHRRPQPPETRPMGYQQPYDPRQAPQRYPEQQHPRRYAEPQQPRYAEPQPQRYAEPAHRGDREPAPRREPRPRSRTRIPGAGCLKGCLFTILIIVVIFILVWNFTPVPQWIADGKTWWQATSDWISSAWHWISSIGAASSGSPGTSGGGNP
jgi:serine/threonine-protein kinase